MSNATYAEWLTKIRQLLQSGQAQSAVQVLDQLLGQLPNDAQLNFLMGMAQHQVGQTETAEAHLKHAATLAPGHPEVLNGLGTVYLSAGNLDGALEAFNLAVQAKPDYASVYNNLGVIYKKKRQYQRAEKSYRQAVSLAPRFGDAWNNLGFVLQDQARIEEALNCFKKASQSGNCRSNADSNYLMALNYSDQRSAQEIYQEHRQWGAQFDELNASSKRISGDKPLTKIAFMSGDFREHSVAYFLLPLLKHLDRSSYQVYCYYNHTQVDALTESLRSFSDYWFDVSNISDEQLAAQVEQDQVDILIELSGHTGKNRLRAMARRIAPLQMTWLGYPATTGLKAIDYRISDQLADPAGCSEAECTEQLLYLDDAFLVYEGIEEVTPKSSLPSESEAGVTFGSFNNFSKLSETTLRLWCRLLISNDKSRLLLKSGAFNCKDSCEQVLDRFEQEGVVRDRVLLIGSTVSTNEHLKCYDRIDVALDTFPYHGTTTTFEALWMGVPVVSLTGDRHASRVGRSILTNAGLADCLAQDEDAYVRIASELAADESRRKALRSSLREQLKASVLGDAEAFARKFEKALESAWKSG